jgi:hypothetical protein
MATSSTYIQLSASVLLEYEYRNQGGTANEYTTNVAPWYLMENAHDNSIAIFNSDNTQVTGNVRTRMGTITDTTLSQYGYLELDLITALNDYDPKLTDTVDLPVNFIATQVVAYDVVRLHLVQGFNFENQKGFQFNLSYENENDVKVQYLNLAYQDSDNYAQINPEPFIFGGKYYASYIEIKVPALYNLVDEYWSAIFAGTPTTDLPSFKLSGNAGPKRNSLIQSEFAWIVNEKEINGQQYFYSYDSKRIDLPTLDQFSNLSAEIQEADDGDYIELFAAWNGQIIDNFIRQLNDVPGNDYIILHELNVYEYIWPAGGSTATWIRTGGLEFVQDTQYEDPIPYRPIIQNSGSVAYRIDYTVRLYNRQDSSSIWKSGTFQSSDAAKWSKYLRRIYLGSNPIQPKVYNKIVEKNVNFFGSTDTQSAASEGQGYAKFVTSFLTTNNIVLSAQNAFIQRNPVTGQVNITSVGNSQSEIIYAQGLSKINMTDSDTFIKFVIYKGDPNSAIEFMDLTGLGTVYLNFFADSGEIKKFQKFNSSDISEANGEILFKVPQKDAQRISQYTNKSYTITSDNGEAESQLYTGTFVKVSDQVESLLDRKIINLEKQLEELTQKNQSLEELLALEETSVESLKVANKEQNTKIQDLQKALDQKIEENNALIADDELDEKQKAELKAKVEELDAAKASLTIQLDQSKKEVKVLDPNCPTQFVKLKPNNPKRSAASPYTS